MITAPFRWAGSKAKLTSELFVYFKENDTYIEPFLGSGVVLFRLIQDGKYKRYIVNDINQAIISFYKAVRDNPTSVVMKLNMICYIYNNILDMSEKEEKYYSQRDVYNVFKSDWESFWLLMKTGFNGLYRENSKGKYNVPFGKKNKIKFDESQIFEISRLIKNVEFYSMDYKDFIELVKKDAFIYCDPPYVGSQQYSSTIFNNYELANYIHNLGMDVAVSDIDSIQSENVYKDFFKVQIKSTKRVINIASVQEVKEVLYINYDI